MKLLNHLILLFIPSILLSFQDIFKRNISFQDIFKQYISFQDIFKRYISFQDIFKRYISFQDIFKRYISFQDIFKRYISLVGLKTQKFKYYVYSKFKEELTKRFNYQLPLLNLIDPEMKVNTSIFNIKPTISIQLKFAEEGKPSACTQAYY